MRQVSKVNISPNSLGVERFLLIAELALFVGKFSHSWVLHFTKALDGGIHSFVLLARYAKYSGVHLSLAFYWFLFGPAATVCFLWLAKKLHPLTRMTSPASCILS